MAQENTRKGFVARVANALSRKPAAAAVPAAPVVAVQATATPQQPKLTSDQMFNAITAGGRCLPG